MSIVPKDLMSYIEIIESKYPDINPTTIADIVSNVPLIKRVDGFELAFVVEKKLGLNRSYFAKALARETDLKATVVKEYEHIFVKLDSDIKQLLNDNYICCRIDKEDVEAFDYVVSLSKRTLLGFYK